MLPRECCLHSQPVRQNFAHLSFRPRAEVFRRAKARPKPSRTPSQRANAVAETEKQSQEGDTPQLEGIDSNYCDEFVCQSSPAVEQNVKALARDLLRLNTYTSSLYTKDIQYKDTFRSFQGIDKLQGQTYIMQTVGKPKVLVTRMRMLGRGKAQIDWRLRGSVMAADVDVNFQTDFTLNLITGRVLEMEERWNLDNCSASGKAFFNVTRAAWSARQSLEDLKSGASSLLDKVGGGGKDDDSSQRADMSAGGTLDPTRFTQENDPSFQDGLTIITLLAILYTMYKAYSIIFKI